ncbi:MAG: metal ABC transporter permease [Candidatus Ratteibacteria bacterium]
MMEILKYEFVRNALISAILVSITCGIVGTFVIVKRMVFISGGISHAVFGGVGLGYLLGINPIITAIPFSIFSAISIGTISKKTKISEDAAIGILWTLGMALGVIFVSLSKGYAPDLFSYLFGSILTVSSFDLIVMLFLNILIILNVILFYREFLAISFDEEFSEIIGIPVKNLYLLLLCLVALSIVVLIRVVGIILVMALLTIPSVIVKQFTHDLKKIIFLSIITGIILTITGLFLSFKFDLPSGATIVMVLCLSFFISYFIKNVKKK